MVMFDELVDELAQMSLAKRNHAIETLLFDRADEPLGIGVEIGILRWQPNRLDTATRQDLAEDPRVQGIAVVDQRGRGPQTAPSWLLRSSATDAACLRRPSVVVVEPAQGVVA